jgi:hypothetical protein
MIYNGTNVTIKLTEQGVNLHNPTSADIYYKKPSGQTGSWSATIIANHIARKGCESRGNLLDFFS